MPGWLGVCILLLALPLSSWAQCSRPSVSPTSAPPDVLSGLKPLASGAERARQALLIPIVHYESFVETIRKMYMQGMFSEEGLVSLVWQHSNSIGFLAGIMLFTAAAIPLLIFGLCLLRERCCCCQDDDSETYAEDNRNLNFSAQMLAWFLCAGLSVCLLFLLGWVSVLLAGEFKLYNGVDRAGKLINTTLPLVERLQTNSLEAVHSTVFDRFQSLNYSIFHDYLSNVPAAIRDHINLKHSANVTTLFNKVSDQLSTTANVSQWFQSINSIHLQLEQLNSSLAQINMLTDDLRQCCSQDNSSSLACQQLMTNSTDLQLNLTLPLSSLISNLTSFSIMIASANPVYLVDKRRTQYEQYLEHIVINTTDWITTVSSQFLDSLHQNLSQFVYTTCSQFNSSTITLGLPSSQRDVASHVGSRYLSNWQKFRNLVTIAFSLSMVVLVVGVGVATVRGLLNIWLTYSYRELEVEKSILFGTHQAGLALRRMAGWMAVTAFVAMFFFLFLLFLGSLLGRMCGNDKSFRVLITQVFDNTSTWNNISPLDQAFLNTDTTFLKFSHLLQSCSQNSSVVEALRLNKRLNIDANLNVSMNRTDRYRDDLRAAASYPFFPILTPELELILNQYQSVAVAPIDWELYSNLSNNQHLIDMIIASNQLHQVLINLNTSVNVSSCMQSIPISNVTEQLQTIIDLLNELDLSLPSTARMLEMELERVLTGGSSLLDDADQLSQWVQQVVSQRAHFELTLTSTSIINMVNNYLRGTQQALHCDVGQCYSLYNQFTLFSDATCHELLSGMDIYWTTLLALYICLTIAMILSLTLASRFMTTDAARQMKTSRNTYFSLTDHTFSQMSGSLWLLFSLVVELWFAVSVATDPFFIELCDDCCSTCIWAFAIVFLLLSLFVGAGLRIYQWIVIHRINASNGPRYQQIHRYWLTRVNIVQFYTQLLLFLVQDIPFVALSGIYMTSRMSPTAPAFFTLTISLANMFAFMWMLISGCGQLGEYFLWLQQEVKALLCCRHEGRYTPPGQHPEHHHTMNGREGGMNGGAVYLPEASGVEATMTAIPLHDRHPSHSPVEHNGTMDTSFMGQHPPPHSWESEQPPLPGEDDSDDDGPPQPPQQNYADPVKLDKLPDESDIIRRRELAAQFRQAGVEVAVPQLTRRSYAEASTPRSSNYFGSGDSIAETDMHSSVPSGYTSTDDSSCREDYDYDSDYRSRPRQYLGEISVQDVRLQDV